MPQRAASSLVSGMVSAAALFAAWRTYAPGVRLGCPEEALELLGGERTVRVGRREVGHEADDRPARCGELAEPPAPHAGVELEMQRNGLGKPLVEDDELEPRLARDPHLVRGRRAEYEDPRLGKRVPQRDRLADGRHAEHPRTAFERGAPGVHGAVPVAVGLDDRPELGRIEELSEHLRVVPDRSEVDGDVRAGHEPILAGEAARRRHEGQPSIDGSASATSEATRPAWCGSAPAARPCATAAAAAASTASSPFARNAPTTPVSTSPVPAVASDGGPVSHTTTRPSGAHTIVSGPFEQDDRAEALGAPAAASSRCAETHSDVDVEQAGELAGVRGQHGRRVARDGLEAEERRPRRRPRAATIARAAPGRARAPRPSARGRVPTAMADDRATSGSSPSSALAHSKPRFTGSSASVSATASAAAGTASVT